MKAIGYSEFFLWRAHPHILMQEVNGGDPDAIRIARTRLKLEGQRLVEYAKSADVFLEWYYEIRSYGLSENFLDILDELGLRFPAGRKVRHPRLGQGVSVLTDGEVVVEIQKEGSEEERETMCPCLLTSLD